jgi:hypothetical protein
MANAANNYQIPEHLIGYQYRPATDPTTINHYVGRGGSYNYGDLPPGDILRKMEVTSGVYEREDRLDEFFRNTLIDRRPDAPTLASDETRKDRHSTEILSVRHNGHRTGAIPDRPDMNLSFTERDPRGIATDPNMRKLVGQTAARVRMKDFQSDATSDMQSTSGQRSEQKAIKDRQDTFKQSRSRLKIFETSKDGRAIRSGVGGYSKNKRSDVMNVVVEAPDLRVNESTNANRDAVTRISNAMPIGSRKTVSHRFKIADYSQVRGHNNQVNNDFRSAIDMAEQDQEEAEDSKMATTQAIAYTMATAANRPDTEITAEMTEGMNHQTRRTAKQMANVREGFDNAECSEINPATLMMQHHLAHNKKRTFLCKDTLSRETEVDKTAFGALLNEMRTVKSGPVTFDVRIETEQEQSFTTGRKTKNYKTAGLSTARVGDNQEGVQEYTKGDKSQYRSTSHNQIGSDAGWNGEGEQKYATSEYKDRHARGLGKKSRAKYLGTQGRDVSNELNIENMSRSTSKFSKSNARAMAMSR